MNEDSELQVTFKDHDSSLNLSTSRINLIARGRRDAAVLAEGLPSLTIAPLVHTRQLADAGQADAQYDLGFAYQSGEFAPQDWPRHFLSRHGDSPADTVKRVREAGFPEIGLVPPQDYAEAVKWFRKSAEQGNPAALYSLGDAYYVGRGVPRDHAEALRWFRLAGERGHAGAQNHIGIAYYFGRGVHRDYAESLTWFRKAADGGFAPAETNLAVAEKDGPFVNKADPLAEP